MNAEPRASHPHDRLVKRVFSRPEAAAVELRRLLPAKTAALLDWSTLEVKPGTFVDRTLKERLSDILYSIELKGSGRTALIYVLMEHQSSLERLMAWRLLQYICQIWEGCVRRHDGPIQFLPLIIPVVLYQGPQGWTQPQTLSELLDIPDDVRDAFVPPVELRFEVDELRESVLADRKTRDGVLELVELARSLLRLASHPGEITHERVAPLAPLFERVLAALGVDEIYALWTYVVTVFEPNSPLRDILLDASRPEITRVYATIYDEAVAAGTAKGLEQGLEQGIEQGLEQGVAKGLEQGVEAGVLRGRVQMLMRLLERRGFELDGAREQQVNACTDADVLRDWFDRAVTAATLDEVFGPAQ